MTFNNISLSEILLLNDLTKLANEAQEASEVISNAYQRAFGLRQNEIEVWRDVNRTEYLTHEGIWRAIIHGQEYKVEVTPESIFEYLRDNLLTQEEESDLEVLFSVKTSNSEVVHFFRDFVARAKERTSAKCSAENCW